MSYLLSKSAYLRFLHCPKSLWLYRNRPGLRGRAVEEQQAAFTRGHQVGALAQQLFPGGVDAAWDSPAEFMLSLQKTTQAVARNAHAIYEASFLHGDTLIALDILCREGEEWVAYEVKSSLSLKSYHLRDAALQYQIMEGAGLPISRFNVVTLNRDYVRGEELDIKRLFRIHDVTREVHSLQTEILDGLDAAREVLQGRRAPRVELGPQCITPWPCEFVNHCWKGQLTPDSIFGLTDLEEERKWALFDRGIYSIKDLPANLPLSYAQNVQLETLQDGSLHWDKEGVREWCRSLPESFILGQLNYLMPAVPLVPGTSPYHKLPYLFSSLQMEGGQPAAMVQRRLSYDIREFAAQLAQTLAGVQTLLIPDGENAMWALRSLGKLAGGDAGRVLNSASRRTIDLDHFFRRRLIYHPRMAGSVSMESVLPVFGLDKAPFFNPIQSASQADAAFEAAWDEPNPDKANAIREMVYDFAEYRMRKMGEMMVMLMGE